MKVEINGGLYEDLDSVASFPNGSNASVSLNNPIVRRCGKAVEERDPVGLLANLGLPADTPADLVLEVLRTLKENNQEPPARQEELVKESKLWPFVGKAADSATIVQALIALGSATIKIPLCF